MPFGHGLVLYLWLAGKLAAVDRAFVCFREKRQADWLDLCLALILSLTFFTFPRPPGTEVSGVVEEVQTYRFFVKDGRARYAFEGEFPDLKEGDRVHITYHALEMETPSNDSDFNEKHYLLGKGVGIKGR